MINHDKVSTTGYVRHNLPIKERFNFWDYNQELWDSMNEEKLGEIRKEVFNKPP